MLNTFLFGVTEKKIRTENTYVCILVKVTILKILNRKLSIFFVKLQHEISTMFLLFLAAHQSSTRIARINNKINYFLCFQGYYFATIKEK